MVLNSIFIYSHDGHTLVFRDYNPGESTVDVSRKFVTQYLPKAIKKHDKLKNSFCSSKHSAALTDEITEKHSTEGLPIIEIDDTGYFAVYIIKEEVVYTAFTKSDTHLLVVIEYLRVLIETLEETIKTDIWHEIPKRPKVNLVLDLLIDYSIPILPSKNFLMMFIQKDSYQKVMDKAVEEVRTNDDAFWHPHLENILSYEGEWLFDHDEILTGIIDQNGIVQACEIMGKLDVENKSAEVHNVQFHLRHPQKIESFSLHKWAKAGRKRFIKDNILSFTPGMNKFTVTKYICNPFQFALPFELVPIIKLDSSAKTLKIKMELKSQQVAGITLKITDFLINLSFPSFLSGSSVTSSDDKTSTFLYNENSSSGTWKIGSLRADTEYKISGGFHLPPKFIADNEEVDIVASIEFNIQSYIISGAHVENIKLRDKANPVDVVRGLKSTTRVRNLEMRIHIDE